MLRPPPSISAGVTRTSVPANHSGRLPVTGTESRCVSSSRVWNPMLRVVRTVAVVIASPVIIQIIRSKVYYVVSPVNLTPTSAIVLRFLDLVGEATTYDLKKYTVRTVGHFWTF